MALERAQPARRGAAGQGLVPGQPQAPAPPPPPAEVHTLLCEQNPPARQVKDNMVPVIQQLALPATPAGHHHHFCDGLGCR